MHIPPEAAIVDDRSVQHKPLVTVMDVPAPPGGLYAKSVPACRIVSRRGVA